MRWLWRFWRSSSATRFDAGVRALLALNRRTLELFDSYREAGVRFEMHSTGLVIVARSPSGLEHYAKVFRRLRELGYDGGEPEQLGRDALLELEPALDGRTVAIGLHAHVDRYVRPEELTSGLADKLREGGTEILENREVLDLRRRGDGWTLATDAGETRADKVVVSASLQSVRLLKRFGVRVAIQPARGYSVTVAGKGTPPRHALYLAEARIGLSPYSGGVRVAGVFELGAARAEAPAGMGERLLAAAASYLADWQPEVDGTSPGVGRPAARDRRRSPADRRDPRARRAVRCDRPRDARYHARACDRCPARTARARRPHGARAPTLRTSTPVMRSLDDLDGRIGEGWGGERPNGAHINVVLARRGSPTAAAAVSMLAHPSPGHTPVLVCVGPTAAEYEPVWPPTLMMNKATALEERHQTITWGAAQLGIGQGVLDAVADGLIEASGESRRPRRRLHRSGCRG